MRSGAGPELIWDGISTGIKVRMAKLVRPVSMPAWLCELGEPLADHCRPIPVSPPDNKDMFFGPLYTGSPYLGGAGTLPPGEGGFNPFGAYPFMWHSHAEKELTSYNVFPGGMLTWALVVPHAVPDLLPPE